MNRKEKAPFIRFNLCTSKQSTLVLLVGYDQWLFRRAKRQSATKTDATYSSSASSSSVESNRMIVSDAIRCIVLLWLVRCDSVLLQLGWARLSKGKSNDRFVRLVFDRDGWRCDDFERRDTGWLGMYSFSSIRSLNCTRLPNNEGLSPWPDDEMLLLLLFGLAKGSAVTNFSKFWSSFKTDGQPFGSE